MTPDYVQHAGLQQWVTEMVDLCKPANVHWCDGSDAEYQKLVDLMVANANGRIAGIASKSGTDTLVLTQATPFTADIRVDPAGAEAISITDVAAGIDRKIGRLSKPEVAFPVRSLGNVKYDPRKGYFQIGKEKSTRTLTVNTACTSVGAALHLARAGLRP